MLVSELKSLPIGYWGDVIGCPGHDVSGSLTASAVPASSPRAAADMNVAAAIPAISGLCGFIRHALTGRSDCLATKV
jgi:hypothetical protein